MSVTFASLRRTLVFGARSELKNIRSEDNDDLVMI